MTTYIRNTKTFSKKELFSNIDYSDQRWTVDTAEDLIVIRNIFSEFSPDLHFGWKEVLELQLSKPAVFETNQHIKRGEGSHMGSGQKLWSSGEKRLYLVEICFFQRDPRCFFPKDGQHTLAKPKGAKFGILMERVLRFVYNGRGNKYSRIWSP